MRAYLHKMLSKSGNMAMIALIRICGPQMLERKKAEIQEARDRELDQIRSQVVAEGPTVLDQAAAELLAEDNGFRFLYKRDKSALENYQSRPSLQAFFNPYLARIIHQPKKSTRENPFGGQMILTTLISQDHHAPKARSSDGLDSVQSGLSVVSRRTSSWQPPRADHHRFVRDPPEVSMALTGPATSDAPTLTTLHSALRLARLGTTRATKSGSVLEPLARGHPVSVSAIGSWPS